MTFDFNQEVVNAQSSLKSFAYKFTGNEEEAKDLLQETMLKALSYRSKFKKGTNLRAWLYTIMKNTFINNYRKAVRANTLIDTTEENYFINQTKSTNDDHPESVYNHQELEVVIASLEDTYKVPFMMYFNGFRYKEIADHLDLPIGTVKSRIFLARRKLMLSLPHYQHNDN
jgi:RNA polymerase sigma-70 factor (ECF subfamily)